MTSKLNNNLYDKNKVIEDKKQKEDLRKLLNQEISIFEYLGINNKTGVNRDARQL